MRRPKLPPAQSELLAEASKSGRVIQVLEAQISPTQSEKYLHWDKLRYHDPPNGLTHREWWLGVKFARQQQYHPVPLTDKSGQEFKYMLPDPGPEQLHRIDLQTGGRIQMPEQITNPETKDQYYVSSLMEEAITSSQLEGATTTRKVAKNMLQADREPRDRSERMIMNNYMTMRKIGQLKDKDLTKEVVFDIHRLVTMNTLDDPSAAGRFRRDDESVEVGDDYGEVFHRPPHASELEDRMMAMCDFANGNTPDSFMHPVFRSIILHFWLAYDHPFVDGNGRTARALFYWSMLRYGYWLFEYLSISTIIRKGPTKYGRAFLHTETDDNDLTYFVLYHLQVIKRAVDQLYAYLERKTKELRQLESELRGLVVLNHRQRALVSHALRHPNHMYTIESHRRSHNVVYETARKDLFDLCDRKLILQIKIGRTWHFSPIANMHDKLRDLE